MSHSDYKLVVMLLVIFSFLGIFGLAEIIKETIAWLRKPSIKRSTRLYQGDI